MYNSNGYRHIGLQFTSMILERGVSKEHISKLLRRRHPELAWGSISNYVCEISNGGNQLRRAITGYSRALEIFIDIIKTLKLSPEEKFELEKRIAAINKNFNLDSLLLEGEKNRAGNVVSIDSALIKDMPYSSDERCIGHFHFREDYGT